MADNFSARKERFKRYLLSIGCKEKDIDHVLNSYTQKIVEQAYDLGWRRLLRINKQARAYSRELAIKDYEEFAEKWVDKLPIETQDELRRLFYDNLPIIH
jgi:hypothetical protein